MASRRTLKGPKGVAENFERLAFIGLATALITAISFTPLLLRFSINGSSLHAVLALVLIVLLSVGVIAAWSDREKLVTALKGQTFGKVNLALIFILMLINGMMVTNLLFLSDRSPWAIQAVVAFAMMSGGILFFAGSSFDQIEIHSLLSGAGVLAATLVLIDEWALGSGTFSLNSASQFLLIPLASLMILAHRQPFILLLFPVVFQAIIVLASRTAIATAIVILLLGVLLMRRINLWQRLSLLGISALVFGLSFVTSARFTERFAETGDRGFSVPLPQPDAEPIPINTNGRVNIWRATWGEVDSGSVLFGKGASYSRSFVEQHTAGVLNTTLNEYLRILVDFGAVTLGLWLVFLGGIFVASIARMRQDSMANFGAISAVVSLGLMSATDVPLALIGILLPFAAIIGLWVRDSGLRNSSSRIAP